MQSAIYNLFGALFSCPTCRRSHRRPTSCLNGSATSSNTAFPILTLARPTWQRKLEFRYATSKTVRGTRLDVYSLRAICSFRSRGASAAGPSVGENKSSPSVRSPTPAGFATTAIFHRHSDSDSATRPVPFTIKPTSMSRFAPPSSEVRCKVITPAIEQSTLGAVTAGDCRRNDVPRKPRMNKEIVIQWVRGFDRSPSTP